MPGTGGVVPVFKFLILTTVACLAMLITLTIGGQSVLPWSTAAATVTGCGLGKQGTAASETLEGTRGQDRIQAGGGGDLVKGKSGGDCLRGGGGGDTVRGGADRDDVGGGTGGDTVRGGGSHDVLHGGGGGDTVRGGAGPDHLSGGPGPDRLVSWEGRRDKVRCGPGDDVAIVDRRDTTVGCERTRPFRSGDTGGGGNGGGGGHGGGHAGGYPSIADAQADRDGDFDAGCQLFGGESGWHTDNIGSDRPGNGEIVRSLVGQGACAAHLWASGEHRTEVAFSQIPNPDVVYEELFYVPAASGHLGFMNQHKQDGSAGGCANGGISNRSGSELEVTVRASCSADNVRYPVGTYPRGRWFAIRVAFRMGNQGQVAFWLDPDGPGPDPYAQRLAPTTADVQTGDSTGVKFRQGSYGDQTVDFYIDGFRLELR